MDTPVKKITKRFSWQSFAVVLTTLGGILSSQEVRDLVASYPEALIVLAFSSLVVMNLTKIVNAYLKAKKEIKELESL